MDLKFNNFFETKGQQKTRLDTEFKNALDKQRKSANIKATIKMEQQLHRVSQGAQSFKLGVQAAESVMYPNRYLLMQTYQQIVVDGQMQASLLQRKMRVASQKFNLIDSEGNIDKEKTRLLRTAWFSKAMDLAMDSKFWGFSLIQFAPIEDSEMLTVELVPRIYVVPEFDLVRTTTATVTEGKKFTKKPYSNWCVGVGDKRDLGLLQKCAPYIIWKNNAMGAWAEFCEIFGLPIRVVKTDVTDDVTRRNAENMMANMSVSSWAVLGLNDEYEILQTNRSDSFQVFDKFAERCNSEISKIMLGQTGTTEEKAHVGSAAVHQDIAEMVGRKDLLDMEFVVNDQFLPMFREIGFEFEGLTFEYDMNEVLALGEQAKIESLFMPYMQFNKEYLEKKYKMQIDKMNDLKDDSEANPAKKPNNI
jgi:hypothetical protein